MNRFAVVTLLLVLSACASGPSAQPCPSWQEMQDGDLLSTTGIGALGPELGVSVWFAYLNPTRVGECVLGKQAYAKLNDEILTDKQEIHVFWVAASGPYAAAFKAESHHLVQGDRKINQYTRQEDVAALPIQGAPKIKVQYLLAFKGRIDPRDPVTIFFERGDGTYSTEYWLDDTDLP
jgi:hypothetical protein